jgi:signal transduction histidine kinase
MRKLRTRSKYLIIKLLIAAGLTTSVIVIARYSIERDAKQEIGTALGRCMERVRTLQDRGLQPLGGSATPRATPGEIRQICGCDVAIVKAGALVASSLSTATEKQLAGVIPATDLSGGAARTIILGNEDYEVKAIPSPDTADGEMLVFQPWTEIRDRQAKLARLLTLLAIGATLVGFPLVLKVSDAFGKPLNNLVGAVRALEAGDYNYPVAAQSNDELEEVTLAFEDMRATLQTSQKKLIQSERLATIGQMASSISHDLRHSLSAIIANAEFLADEKLADETRLALYQEIRSAVEQMNDLIESLLEFSRGREAPRVVRVNPADVVEHAIRTVKTKAAFQSIEFQLEGTETLECELDPNKVERALVNLLLNACEAVATNSGKVQVRWEKRNGALQIRVGDNGDGVQEEVREKLFQPFVSHGKVAGTGLGLAIVQKICEDHGGSITLEQSEPGQTVFCMTLPQSSG